VSKRINRLLLAVLMQFNFLNADHCPLSRILFHSHLFVFSPSLHNKIILKEEKTIDSSVSPACSVSAPQRFGFACSEYQTLLYHWLMEVTSTLWSGVQWCHGVNWKQISEQKDAAGRGRFNISPMLLKGDDVVYFMALQLTPAFSP